MAEKRTSSRRKTLLNGRIEVDKLNGWAVSCTVRNISDGGARVALAARPVVPESFLLGISDAEPRPARVVWYRDGHAGLALAESRARTGDRANEVEASASEPKQTTRLQARIQAIASGPRTRRRFTPL